MAIAKSHQSAIEAELDREMQAEIAATDEQPQPTIVEAASSLDDQSQSVDSVKFARTRILFNAAGHAVLGGAITLKHSIKKIFNGLVEKGENFRYQDKRKQAAEVSAAVKIKTVEKIHDIEHSIDRGKSNTLHWIGVPSQEEFNQLNNKVEELTTVVQVLQQQLSDTKNNK